jgi:cytochrome c biogenesis protein CcmG/thiol:disulfide interchange protein DsbE
VSTTRKRPGKPAPRPAARGGSRWVFPAVLAAIVVVGVIAVVVAASGGGDDGGNATPAAHEVSSEVTVGGTSLPQYTGASKDSAVGMAAPTLGSVDFQGDNVSAGGSTGTPYALVFLAHWCPHCQAEVPRLVDAGKDGTIEGVNVIGVPTGTTKSNPNYPPSAWLEREHWNYEVLLDDGDFTAARTYGLTQYPYLVFVDGSGKVAGRVSGEIAEADLQKIFRALAAGQPLPLPGGGASSSAG